MSKLNQADILSAYNEFGDGDQVFHRTKKIKKIKTHSSASNKGPLVRYTEDGKPVTVYASHIDQNAWKQAEDFASLPFIHPKGMALMPDVHFGKGVPVGAVLPTVGVLVPAAVGVDIGCGMMACKLNLHGNHLPDNLRRLRLNIEKKIPLNSGGRHKDIPLVVHQSWKSLEQGHQKIFETFPKAFRPNAIEQLGTLGSGNHFIEICLDESKNVWVMLHSGSRGAGANIGNHFIEQALRRVREDGKSVHGLGWLKEGDPLFDGYVSCVEWAQEYAQKNREVMMGLVLEAISESMGQKVVSVQKAVACHHNYIARERFANENVWITRKGAISARQGQFGIIPGSMGQESFIVSGLGDENSWCSCSHGAGRVMSRTAATQRFTSKDMREALVGVECRKDRGVIDEIPLAYKPLRSVMKDQASLVKVEHTLKAILCSKGI